MNLNEYQQAALRTERRRAACGGFNIECTGEEERILEGVLGLSGESGEVVDILPSDFKRFRSFSMRL